MGSGSSRNLVVGPSEKQQPSNVPKSRIVKASFPNRAVTASGNGQRTPTKIPDSMSPKGLTKGMNLSQIQRTHVAKAEKPNRLTGSIHPPHLLTEAENKTLALAKREEQEEMSLDQALAQQFKAYEEQQNKLRSLEAAEDTSLQQQELQQYQAFAAAQERVPASGRGERTVAARGENSTLRDVTRVTRRETAKVSSPKAAPLRKQMIFSPDSGTQEERNMISEVIPGKLYLTNFRGVGRPEELEALGIKHIVCVNEQENDFPDRFNYFNIDNLEDQEDHDASAHFVSVTKFTDQALAQGGAVCFHCAAGISRSSTMVIAYLMTSRRMNLLDAFTMTYNARKVTWPNRTFMMQLIEYERKLQVKGKILGKVPSLTIDQWDSWNCAGDEKGSKEASLTERTASLRGRDSLQFQSYQESVRNSITAMGTVKET